MKPRKASSKKPPAEAAPWQAAAGGRLQLRVTPRASAERIRPEPQPDGSLLLRVYVTAPAEDGKANEAVIRLIAKELGLPKSALAIIRGHSSRNKTLAIAQA